MNPRTVQRLLPVLLLPSAAASLLLPELRRHRPSDLEMLAWRAILALPMIALPSLLALARLQPNQRRAAIGLGGGRLHRLRWIWLPQLGPGFGLSILLTVLFGLAELLLR